MAGFVPLAPYCIPSQLPEDQLFAWSVGLTGLVFAAIGIGKGFVVGRSKVWAAVETLAVGGIAAGLAYAIGLAFRVNGAG